MVQGQLMQKVRVTMSRKKAGCGGGRGGKVSRRSYLKNKPNNKDWGVCTQTHTHRRSGERGKHKLAILKLKEIALQIS
jgi:hypothetical protein